MAKRTRTFSLLPWTGGLNTSTDPGLIPANDLTVADNVQFDVRGSRKKRQGIDDSWDNASNSTEEIIALHDFWFESGSSKVHRIVGVADDGNIYSYDSGGTRSTLTNKVEVTDVTTVAVAALSDGDYFLLNSADDTTEYYVWYDTTGGASDPSLPGKTGIKCDVSGDTTADDVATTTATQIDLVADFGATSASDVVTITNAAAGETTDASDSSGGTATDFTISVTTQGTSPFTSPDRVSMITFGNRVMIGAEVASGQKVIKYWDGDASTGAINLEEHPLYEAADPDFPGGYMLREHLGRVWSNDPTRPDRLHYSETANPFKWGGYGDSGAIDIGQGDGDQEGITAIFPTFRGELFVAKRTKLYRISGTTPETFTVELVSNALGCVAHNAAAGVDGNDVLFVSDRGIHSIQTTSSFGDFETKYLSTKIQRTFNDEFNRARFKYVQARYSAPLNSVAFTFSDVGSNFNDQIYLYNIEFQTWYAWPNRPCSALAAVQDADTTRFYIGRTDTRVSKSETGNNFDTDTAGVNQPINFKIETGFLYITRDPYQRIAFKKISLVYRPSGTHTITVRVQIDKYNSQAVTFTNMSSFDVLGDTFILGQSLLGSEGILAPYTQPIDGVGRGVRITVEQSGTDEEVEIQGIMVEYEDAGTAQEVLLGE